MTDILEGIKSLFEDIHEKKVGSTEELHQKVEGISSKLEFVESALFKSLFRSFLKVWIVTKFDEEVKEYLLNSIIPIYLEILLKCDDYFFVEEITEEMIYGLIAPIIENNLQDDKEYKKIFGDVEDEFYDELDVSSPVDVFLDIISNCRKLRFNQGKTILEINRTLQ